MQRSSNKEHVLLVFLEQIVLDDNRMSNVYYDWVSRGELR